jgi:hypothetical protein
MRLPAVASLGCCAAVRRPLRSPTSDAATRPAFVRSRSPLVSSHSCRHAPPASNPNAADRCPLQTAPECGALPRTSSVLKYGSPNTSLIAFGVVPSLCSSTTSPASSKTHYQLDRSPRSKPIVSFCSRKFLFCFTATVPIFFIAGLLYLLRFERVDNLGANRIPPETGILIPSGYINYRGFAGLRRPLRSTTNTAQIRAKYRAESILIAAAHFPRTQESGASSKVRNNPGVGNPWEYVRTSTSVLSAKRKATAIAGMQSSTVFIPLSLIWSIWCKKVH